MAGQFEGRGTKQACMFGLAIKHISRFKITAEIQKFARLQNLENWC